MTSYIIFAEDEVDRQAKLAEFCNIYSIQIVDRTLIHSEKETSLGIETVKKLQEKAMLKPLRGKDKAIVIPQSELLTIPAQNALLKLLEEPPAHTYFFLLTNSLEIFLPTILSRCQVIKLAAQTDLTTDETTKLTDQLQTWQRQSIGDALKSAEKLAKDKDSTLQLFKQTMQVGAKKLQEKTLEEGEIRILANQLKTLQQTYRTLNSTNTNPRLALENLFLSLITN